VTKWGGRWRREVYLGGDAFSGASSFEGWALRDWRVRRRVWISSSSVLRDWRRSIRIFSAEAFSISSSSVRLFDFSICVDRAGSSGNIMASITSAARGIGGTSAVGECEFNGPPVALSI
jgi:hypothetical protein